MSRTLQLDQVFYGTSPSGYGILGTSLTDKSVAQSAVNACLAVGQNPGSGLVKPIHLSRVLGDRIVMARLCNGGKDSSGRNSIFVHALVASAQEVRSAHVTTFSLEDDGAFCNWMPDSSSMPVIIEARSPSENTSSVPLELPAAIETSEPDITLMRRIVSGRENELSWSTFAFDDMPGYDIIFLSQLASSPDGRNIYDTDLRLVRGAIVKENVPVPASPPRVEKPSCPPHRNPMPTEGVREGRNGLLVPLLLSIMVNVVLLAVLTFSQTNTGAVTPETSSDSSLQEIVEAAMQTFNKSKFPTDEMIKSAGYPLSELAGANKDAPDSLSKKEELKDQLDLVKNLLYCRDVVANCIKNLKQTKEK